MSTIHASPPLPIEPGSVPRQIEVRAPARLHLGFLDPGATLGRRFGSLGAVIDGPQTVVRLTWADGADDEVVATCLAATAELDRARAHLRRLRERLPLARLRGGTALGALRLELAETLPPHAGLGSGTQLALAIGRAYAELGATGTSTADLARLLGRGRALGRGHRRLRPWRPAARRRTGPRWPAGTVDLAHRAAAVLARAAGDGRSRPGAVGQCRAAGHCRAAAVPAQSAPPSSATRC